MKIRIGILAAVLICGCYNRYKSPLIWQGLPYPHIHTAHREIPCNLAMAVFVDVKDKRAEHVGDTLPGTRYKSQLINDNELVRTEQFVKTRLYRYFHAFGADTLASKTDGKPDLIIDADVNVITPHVRGCLWMWVRGMVELHARVSNSDGLLFEKTYKAVAKDGDTDVPPPNYAALTIEYAGKLVTATAIKRVSDELITDICREIDKMSERADR